MPALTSANNPITVNGTYTLRTDPGAWYSLAFVSTAFPSIALSWLSEDGLVSTAFPESPLTASGVFRFFAPSKQIQLVVTGWTSAVEVLLNKSADRENTTAAILEECADRSKGVVVSKANGTRTAYQPSANTDAARGLALEAAFASAVAGDTIDLSPGNYDVAKATTTVIAVATHYSVLAGMTIRLNGARLYHQIAFTQAVFFGANEVDGWSILGPGIIEGTAATSTGSNEMGINTWRSRRWLIAYLTIRYFRNTGIQENNSIFTGGDYVGTKVSTGRIIACNVDLNNIGIAIFPGSEYTSITGCTFNKNRTGCDIYAGNTRFLNCESTYNIDYGIIIRDGGNDGHGVWVGGMLNHNLNYAVHVEAGMINGFTFQGSHFYGDYATSNKIQSLGGGCVFTGCTIDSPFYASATPSGINLVTSCHMPIAVVSAAQAVADLLPAERKQWVFLDNHTLVEGWANNDERVYQYTGNAAALVDLTAGRRYYNSTSSSISLVI